VNAAPAKSRVVASAPARSMRSNGNHRAGEPIESRLLQRHVVVGIEAVDADDASSSR
jgi:hypothetical protein